jgi:uncharacterized protein
MKLQFDPAKAKSNRKKHGVSFADAENAFYDPFAVHQEDPFAAGEERWIGLGMGNTGRVLVVVYTYRGAEIRLISVRQATSREVVDYES